MKIINNTDTELVVTGRNAVCFKRISAGTSAHIDPKFDGIVISCGYGHIDVDTFRLDPHGALNATFNFDFESNDYVVEVYHIKTAVKQSNSCVEQQDETLHDNSIRDTSTHLTSSHIAAYRRIDELTDAIKKSIQICVPNETTSDVKLIRNWAKEIMLQCNIIDSIDED